MHKINIFLLIGALLTGCASTTEQTSYNRGVEAYKNKNYHAARANWSKAVDQGEDLALNNLGFLMYNGWGGATDKPKAIELWLNAARRGVSESQWHLGSVYESGDGLPLNLVEAYAWYRCSVVNAELKSEDDETEAIIAEDARKSLTKILSKLSSKDFEAAEKLAAQYIQLYAKK